MNIENWPLSRIRPFEKNARKIPQNAIDKVAASLQDYGPRQPIVVDAEGVIVAGHVRRLAALKLGWTEFPVHVATNLTPEQIRGYRLMDNRSHEETDWDFDFLIPELTELGSLSFDLSLTGFDSAELDKLLTPIDEETANQVPPLPDVEVSRRGDLWILGQHRLLCGDATSVADVQRLLEDAKPVLMVTDPPFGISLDGSWRDRAGLNGYGPASIPLSALATFIALQIGGSSINTMVLGGLALALSRLIDNSVVVLENIYRHLELGDPAVVAAEKGGREVALPVLAATLTTVVVFFPVTLLYGVSKFLFSSLALAVVLSLFASYAVAMTVVPLFCARFMKHSSGHAVTEEVGEPHHATPTLGRRFNAWFNRGFNWFLSMYDRLVALVLARPAIYLIIFAIGFAASLLLFPRLELSFFPRTDAGQFVINVKAPSGTKLVETEKEIARLEDLLHRTIPESDLAMIVSNIGVDPGFSAIYTSNSAMHTAFVQVGLKPGHQTDSYEYMARVKARMREEMPELSAYFSSGSLIDAVLNMGLAAPIDVQVGGTNLKDSYAASLDLARQIRDIHSVADAFIPQDIDYPALKLEIDRTRAGELGLSEKEVVQNVITALTSNQMVAPNIWIDPKNNNNYFLNVQYPEQQIGSLLDLKSIPLHGVGLKRPTRLDMVSSITRFEAPTEVDHYQIRRVLDIYVRPLGEGLGSIADQIDGLISRAKLPTGVDVTVRGMVEGMRSSFKSFALGLTLSVLLLYLILVAQFRSFIDPFIILLAFPPGLSGVLLTLWLTNTTLNVMSLMGVVMLAGIAMSNSILIVEFAHHLRREGMAPREAVAMASRVRLRPVLMTSLATVIGLMPMALKFGEGSEAYAPLARALIGGLSVSVLFTVFLVPAGFCLAYAKRSEPTALTNE